LDCVVQAAVKDEGAKEAKELSLTLYHLQVQNKLLNHEKSGLREALVIKKKHKKCGKPLYLQ
ncbi:hypothetical protein CC86DRAFT_430771, partial [Ophiobolus disseminans]